MPSKGLGVVGEPRAHCLVAVLTKVARLGLDIFVEGKEHQCAQGQRCVARGRGTGGAELEVHVALERATEDAAEGGNGDDLVRQCDGVAKLRVDSATRNPALVGVDPGGEQQHARMLRVFVHALECPKQLQHLSAFELETNDLGRGWQPALDDGARQRPADVVPPRQISRDREIRVQLFAHDIGDHAHPQRVRKCGNLAWPALAVPVVRKHAVAEHHLFHPGHIEIPRQVRQHRSAAVVDVLTEDCVVRARERAVVVVLRPVVNGGGMAMPNLSQHRRRGSGGGRCVRFARRCG